MSIKREYRACLFEDDQLIDETVIDDNDPEFAMELFKDEFGHDKLSPNSYVTIEALGLYDTNSGFDVKDNKKNQSKVEK